MEKFIIEGGHSLKGVVVPSGNKNAALPILAASLLTEAKIVVRNVPRIVDVETSPDGVTWTSVFTNPANRPALAYDGGHVASSAPAATTILSTGTLIRCCIDQIATGAATLSVQLLGVASATLRHRMGTTGAASRY